MKETLKFIRDKAMRIKFYMHRTSSYLALANTGMILFLFLSKLKELGFISFDIDRYFIPLIIIGFCLLMLIGWLEVRLRGNQEEAKVQFSLNPYMMEMRSKINDLWEEKHK